VWPAVLVAAQKALVFLAETEGEAAAFFGKPNKAGPVVVILWPLTRSHVNNRRLSYCGKYGLTGPRSRPIQWLGGSGPCCKCPTA